MLRCALVLALFVFSACLVEPSTSSVKLPLPDGGLIPGVTWHGNVAPIIAEHCQRCHDVGGIAPFPLMTYEQSAPLAASIAASTGDRRMPPFLADNSGDCHDWKDANWLSDAELQTLAAWSASGALEGAERDPPAVPALPSIDNPDLTVTMAESFSPDGELGDEYRCFILDPELDRERYITGFEVAPGEARVVHHVIMYALRDENAENSAEALDSADERTGYACYGGAKVPSTMIALWAPGTGAVFFPEGTGLGLRAGGKLVMQIHYNMDNGSFPDQTAIKFALSDSVDNPGVMTLIGNHDLSIPPGVEAHVETSDILVSRAGAPVPVHVWGILPHMHEIGTKYRLERVRAGEVSCMMNVKRWDFNWQLGYFLDEPIRILPTDVLRTTCTFDSRSRTETTVFGEDTSDEMCLAAIFVTRATP